MAKDESQDYPFLVLNALLNEVVTFAENNAYQVPQPSPEMLREFDSAMKELLVLYERLQTLPDNNLKQLLESIATLYQSTQDGLFFLLYVCPLPAQAEGRFDYQKELKSREQQIRNLEYLISWHQHFFKQVLHIAPPLPVPYPDGLPIEQSDPTTQTSQTTNESGSASVPNMLL